MPDDSVLLGQLAEEFSGRVRRGELPAVEEYALRHPALADRIRALFPTLMLLEGMAGARVGTPATVADNEAAPEGALAPGQVFNHYRIEREIGRGGMGVVYEATHLPLDKRVALKVLPLLPGEGAGQLERFLREAKTAAGLHHTNIVPVFDIGQANGTPYFAMQLIDGQGLDRVLRQWQAQPPADLFRRVAQFGAQAAEALAYAHQRGVIHRDIKPSNLLLDGQGVLWVTDFGLARRVNDVALTQAGALVGTPRYMSPEQAEAAKRPVDHRTDVYSLGATLYELLTRRPAFDGPTPVEVLLQVIEREPLPPRKLIPSVPRDLETVILKAMAKRPQDRYATAQEFADDLRRFLGGEPVRARRIGVAGRVARWSRRNPLVAGLLLAVLLTTTGGMAVATWFAWQADRSARAANVSAGQAREASALAGARAEESRQRLVRQYVANGVRLTEEGDLPAALPWLVEALALDAGDPEREEMHRVRIGALLRQAPRLEQVWGHEGEIAVAEFSPDGRRVVTAGGTADGLAGVVHLCDATTGEAALPPLSQERPVYRLAFSPDGKRLASLGGEDLVVWDLETGRRLTSWRPGGEVFALQFSADGRRLFTAWSEEHGRDYYLIAARTWDASTGQPVTPVLEHSKGAGYPGSAAASPDGRSIAVGVNSYNPTRVKVWDTVTGKEARAALPHPLGITSVNYSPDGKRLLTGGTDGVARVWDVQTEQPIPQLLKHSRAVTVARFSPDGRQVLTVADGAIHLWDWAAPKPLRTLRPPHGSVRDAAFRADGLQILAECDDGRVWLWHADGEQAAPRVALPLPVQARLSPDGRRVLTLSGDRWTRLWNVARGEPLQPLDETSWYSRMPWGEGLIQPDYTGFSPDGRRLVVGLKGTARVWDTSRGRLLAGPFTYPGQLYQAEFSEDGGFLVLASQVAPRKGEQWQQTAQVIDLAAGRLLRPPLTFMVLRALTLDADHLRAAVVRIDPDAGAGSQLELWDLAAGRPLGPARSFPGGEVSLRGFSRDGRLLLTLVAAPPDEQGSREGTARVWECASGEPAGPPVPGIGLEPWPDIALSADGGRLLLAGHPAHEKAPAFAARLYDTATGQLLARLPVGGERSPSAALSPAADRVVMTGADGSARVWDVATGRALTLPMRLPNGIVKALFSPDGRRVLGYQSWGAVRLWDARTGEPLTLPLGSLVNDQALDLAGRLLTRESKGPGNGTQTVRVRDLRPDPRPVEELRALAQVLAGAGIDDTGGYVPLEREEYRRVWEDVRAHAPPADPGEDLAWHAAEADRQEWAERWAAAVTHLTPLIEAQPHRWRLYARRGRARLELRQWEPALADLTAAVERDALNPAVWVDRGNARAELGRWKEVVDDFTHVEAMEGSSGTLPLIAMARLGGGDQAGYRQARAGILKRIDEDVRKEGYVSEDEAWPCVLAPPSATDLGGLITLLEKQVTGAKDSGGLRILGAAYTRAGKHQEAIKRLTEAVALREEFPSAWLFLAIAHARAGQANEARLWLDKARKWLDQPGRAGEMSWDDRLRLKVLREEAEALLKG
jgi:WD40 repeat protein